MSALWGEISEVIDVGELFPGVLSRPVTVGDALVSAPAIELNGKHLKLNGKTSELIKILKPGQALVDLYEKLNGQGNRAYFAFSRTHPQRPAKTIAKDSAGLFHYKENRTLTIGEYKRIASLPDTFVLMGTFSSALLRIGNLVPPFLMKAIANQIRHKLWGGDPLTRYPKSMTYPEILESAWQDHLAPRDPDAPTVISTFAGGGGSSLGYSMAGYRELLAVEWDDNAVETFKLNFLDVPVYHGDIVKLSVEECMRLAGVEEGDLDLLDGSPPCQSFSSAGKRDMNDPRGQLFREFVRLLRGLKPKVFVMENVPGLVKGKMKLVFAEIMRELKASGYQVRCKKLNAMYFYVPQSRERLIFIGVRQGKEQNR
jgi:site-specific DNA-cytosine methylase